MLKKLIISIYAIVIIVMAMATFIGNTKGQNYAEENIYGSWWFILLWAIGIALGIIYFIRRHEHRAFTIALHLSFVIILIGALTTFLTARRGTIHLRQGEKVTTYTDDNGKVHDLGFTITLTDFEVKCHEGTTAPEDYISYITISQEDSRLSATISMNNIYEQGNMRLYQSGFENDGKGSFLAINADPIGIPITYTGYALLFVSLVWMLIDKKGTFRMLIKQELKETQRHRDTEFPFKSVSKTIILCVSASLCSLFTTPAYAQTTFNEQESKAFSQLFINYNDRICPVETFAQDFTKKLYGKAHYEDYSASQVLAGFIFWNKEWMSVPVIKVKSGELRERLGMKSDYAAFNDFFAGGDYRLGPWLQNGSNDNFHKAVLDTDDKLMLIMQLRQGVVLKMFPFTVPQSKVKDLKSAITTWYSPVDSLPQYIPAEQQNYMRNILPLAAELSTNGSHDDALETLQKMLKYQYRYGGKSLPSKAQVWAEHTYNSIPFATILFIVNLTLGFLSIFLIRRKRIYDGITAMMGVSLIALTFGIILRWIVKGDIPMANGYETTFIMAWVVMLLSLVAYRYLKMMTTFGLILSGFMLLVSHIGQMDPAITPRMPVLNSPLLSIHVSIIMVAYALLSLTFIISAAYFITSRVKSLSVFHSSLSTLSKLFLLPAMTFLGIGIFVGAIWANVSWGRYWGWDPKEVWALITFMVYAAPLHRGFYGSGGKVSRKAQVQAEQVSNSPSIDRNYHIYMLLAFLVVLMTYFGVNYYLVGMHSYA